MTSTLTPAQLDAYCARIGVARPARADAAALAAVHRAHALGFTWEAIDCFMGWPVSLDPQATWAKMVAGRRGGWCYELNGLLGAALSAMGFSVTRLCGGVRREDAGDALVGNHLTLRVDLPEGPWLAETGLGDALVDPIPLRPGPVTQRGYAFAIERADGDWWRFRNHPWAGGPSFDFRPDYADEARLAGLHAWLREDVQSPFRGNLVVQRHFPDRIESVLNRTRRTVTPNGVAERPIAGADELAGLFERVFDIEVPEVGVVWDKAGEASGPAFG
jgi:N-hydroxyarylamine O-acetyltransferase